MDPLLKKELFNYEKGKDLYCFVKMDSWMQTSASPTCPVFHLEFLVPL